MSKALQVRGAEPGQDKDSLWRHRSLGWSAHLYLDQGQTKLIQRCSHNLVRQDNALRKTEDSSNSGLRKGGPARLFTPPPWLAGWLDDEAEQNQQMPPEAERKAQPQDLIRDKR